MKKALDFVKHYARSDALYRGTALSSNLILLSIIATTPEFGSKGILGNAFLQLTINGLLEIPTGRFADRFGWVQSIKIGLRIKFITTVLFALAVLSISKGLVSFSWMLIALEAIADAFAVSFINGAYTAAYGKWYHEKLKSSSIAIEDAPPLFVSSFKYAFPIRIGLPIISLSIGSIAFFYSNFNPKIIFSLLIAFIFLLRFVVYFRVTHDLKSVKNEIRSKGEENTFSVAKVASMMPTPLVLYGISILLSLGTSFYLYGEIYKYLSIDNPELKSIWLKGTVVGLAINLITVLTSKFLSSKIVKFSSQQIFQIAPVILFVFTALTLLSGFLIEQALLNGMLLFVFCVFAATFGQLLQGWISSNVIKQLPESVRATWSSIGEVFGLIGFGVIAAFGLLLNYSFSSELVFFIGILIFTVFCYTLIIFDKTPVYLSSTSLKSYLTRAIIGTTTVCLVILVSFDVVEYKYKASSIKENSNTIVLNALSAALKEPVRQGSYTEILARVNSIQIENTDVCVVVSINNNNLGECESFSRRKNVKRITKPIFYDEERKKEAAMVSLYCDYSEINSAVFYRVVISIFGYAVLGFLLFILILQASKQIIKEVDRLKRKDGLPDEHFVISEFALLSSELDSYAKLKEKAITQEISSKIASQVSHDIRSPLSALEMMLSTLSEVPEDRRVIIRNAVNRIKDIANSLLEKNKALEVPSHETVDEIVVQLGEPLSVTLLAPLIESVITEKRTQYRNQIKTEIEFNQTLESYGLFSFLQENEFKRVLSNIINNSVDALVAGAGRVDVSLSTVSDGVISILISDNGRGMTDERIKLVGQRGVTFGKKNGYGLGLSHALESVSTWGGSLTVKSKPNKGTTIAITLPKHHPSAWFVPGLILKSRTTLVVFDDDQAIHHIWKERIEALPSVKVNIVNLSSPSDLRTYFGKNFADLDDVLFLMDYEIINHNETGLDLIEELGIASQSILVTSRYEERLVRDRYERLGVKLIPKSMSGFVPIQVV